MHSFFHCGPRKYSVVLCSAVKWQQCSEVKYRVLQYNTPAWPPHCPRLWSTTLHWTLYCNVLNCTLYWTLYWTVQYTVLYFIVLHCTGLRCTGLDTIQSANMSAMGSQVSSLQVLCSHCVISIVLYYTPYTPYTLNCTVFNRQQTELMILNM